MSAEVLREAAALMRERAKNARAGRWVATDDEVNAHWTLGDVEVAVCRGSIPEGDAINAEHIASWHPAVALAVAAMLETEAEMATTSGPGWATDEALAVARAYLGGTR